MFLVPKLKISTRRGAIGISSRESKWPWYIRVCRMVNWLLIYKELGNLGTGALYTIGVSFGAVIIGVILGLLNAIMRLNSRKWLSYPAGVYFEIFRNTPMLVQILLMYYGVFPMLSYGGDIRALFENYESIAPVVNRVIKFLNDYEPIFAGIIALGLNSGAYLGEIFRGGILSIDRGQREAALSLGMSEYQSMRYIVLPQALTNALPALGNEFVTLIKDSSLLSVIAVAELTYRAQLVGGRKFEYFTMYVGIGLIYFLVCFTLSRYLARVEKKMRVGLK